MQALSPTLPLESLRGQDEIRRLSCFLDRSAYDGKGDEEARLKKVAQSFDAIFVRQLLREMRATLLKSSLFGSGADAEIFQEMHDDCLAEAIGQAGGFGLGELIYREMAPSTRRLSAEEVIQMYEDQSNATHGEIQEAEGKS